MIPAFIICRDRFTCTVNLTKWLESAGIEDIYLIDNDSTYEPLLDFYEKTNHTVIKMGNNHNHLIPWNGGFIDKYAKNKHYIVSDPDILPIEECPFDIFEYFLSILDRYPQIKRIGPGLKIDDLPDHYSLKSSVIDQETENWRYPSLEPGIILAPIDTTLALHRPNVGHGLGDCARTDFPYLARHTPWYIDSNNISDEERHYRSRLDRAVSHWNRDR